jgi:thioredoxin reductase
MLSSGIYDFVIIGGGIIGAATAMALQKLLIKPETIAGLYTPGCITNRVLLKQKTVQKDES